VIVDFLNVTDARWISAKGVKAPPAVPAIQRFVGEVVGKFIHFGAGLRFGLNHL
jgi:hypothetical protein